jgi:ABC-type branched-subunit amino acid transport system permease subunit
MNEVFLFALLGLGSAAVYALLASGIIVVFKGTGVINFSQGAIATIAAYSFVSLRPDLGTPLAIVVATTSTVLLAGALGLIMRTLATAPRLAKMVASLGLLLILQGAIVPIWGVDARNTPPIFPRSPIRIFGGSLGQDRLWLALLAVVVTVVLAAVVRWTRAGMIAEAVAESEDAASLVGISPARVSVLTWAVGGLLAAIAGIGIVPLTGLSSQGFTFYLIPALGAALLARFRSIGIGVAASFAIGIAQSLVGHYVHVNGSSAVLPFVVIVVAVVLAGSRLPLREERVLGRLPAVASGRIRLVGLGIAGVAIWALIALTDRSTSFAMTSTGIAAILMLSIVVLSGYVGQISLMQLSFAGLGGFTVAHLSPHLPMLLCLALGGLLSAAVGIVVGLPALRVRGVNLAIVTLALAVALENSLFSNQWVTGATSGQPVATPYLFGIDLDPLLYPVRFGIFTWIVVLLVGLVLVGVRRSRFGHRMIATRKSEPAAAAAGMNVARTKLQAFALSGSIAGLAGGMLAYQLGVLTSDRFVAFDNVTLVAFAYVGGVGSLCGAVIAGTMLSGSIAPTLLDRWTAVSEWVPLAGGILVILTIIMNPDGVSIQMMRDAKRVAGRFGRLARWRNRSSDKPGSPPDGPVGSIADLRSSRPSKPVDRERGTSRL